MRNKFIHKNYEVRKLTGFCQHNGIETNKTANILLTTIYKTPGLELEPTSSLTRKF